MRGVGREREELGIGHRHAAIHLGLVLHHLAHVIVQAGAETHFAGHRA